MVAHPQLADAYLVVQVLFGLRYAGESLDRDGRSVRDAGGQAGLRGLVPCGQIHLAGQRADFRLRQVGFDHRAADSVLLGGVQPGAEVAQVVGVGSVGDVRVALFLGVVNEVGVEFVLAEEAAVGIVGGVVVALDLVGLYDAVVQPDALG